LFFWGGEILYPANVSIDPENHPALGKIGKIKGVSPFIQDRGHLAILKTRKFENV
jgi:hypothetical protein